MLDRELPKQVLDVIPTAMLFMRRAVKELQKGELKFPHYRLIGYVYRHGRASNCELAEWQGVSVATMSRTIDSMIRWGLLSRSVNEKNRREVLVILTPKGTKVHEEIKERFEQYLLKRIAPLTKQNKEDLVQGLKVLAQLFALEDAGKGS